MPFATWNRPLLRIWLISTLFTAAFIAVRAICWLNGALFDSSHRWTISRSPGPWMRVLMPLRLRRASDSRPLDWWVMSIWPPCSWVLRAGPSGIGTKVIELAFGYPGCQ